MTEFRISSESDIENVSSSSEELEEQEVKLDFMGTLKVAGAKFEITKYDGRSDYLL